MTEPDRSNPKTYLTKFLAMFYPPVEEDRQTQYERNLNTDYPTGETIRLQERDEILGAAEGFDLPFFHWLTTNRASLMVSFERGGRKEAVAGLLQYEQQQKGWGGTNIVFTPEEGGDGAPKRKGLLGR